MANEEEQSPSQSSTNTVLTNYLDSNFNKKKKSFLQPIGN